MVPYDTKFILFDFSLVSLLRGDIMYFKKIADLRIEHGKTPEAIAAILNCSKYVYGRYERGLDEMPVPMIVILAQYYNVSVDYIFEITDIKEPHPRK